MLFTLSSKIKVCYLNFCLKQKFCGKNINIQEVLFLFLKTKTKAKKQKKSLTLIIY